MTVTLSAVDGSDVAISGLYLKAHQVLALRALMHLV